MRRADPIQADVKKIIVAGPILAALAAALAAGWAARFRFPSILIEGIEAPSSVELGAEFPLALSVLPRAPFPRGAALFIHFRRGGERINADVAIPIPMRRWTPGEVARLGPFFCAIPAGAPAGRYEIEAGFYREGRDLLWRRRSVRIPWANRSVRDWTAGALEASPAAPRAWAPEDFGPRGYAVCYAGPLDKVFPGKDGFRGPVIDRVRLSAARNERESFQLVLVPGAEPLKGVRATAGDLRGPGVIGAEGIVVRVVGYVNTRRPYYNVSRTGPWPDPLLPLGDKGVDVPAGRVQPLWVTVAVPPAAPPGDYRGRIEIAPEGAPRTEIEIGLRVWGFTLPGTPSLKTGFDFYEYLVRRYYPRRGEESDPEWRARTEAVCRAFYMDMLAHRISPIHNVGNPALLSAGPHGWRLDFEAFDRRVEEYLASGQTDFGIAAEARVSPEDGIWSDGWYGFTGPDAVRGVFAAYGAHLRERGWIGRAYTYIIDESYRGVKGLSRLIHEGDPGIRFMLTCPPEDGYPDVDIWCVRINDFDPEAARRFKGRGKEVWLYVASPTRPFPTIILDSPSVETRVLPWICRRMGATGMVYWCVNYWHLSDPWVDPMTWPGQNGNGSLYYPGPAGPVASIRLEALRDGMEDYDYLRMAEESGMGEAVSRAVGAVAPSAWEYARDPEALLAARELLGLSLDGRREGGG
jgi:hypothetical protein